MKKYLVIAAVVLAIVLGGYFTMWFFLCQTAALEVSSILKPQFSEAVTSRLVELNGKAQTRIAKKALAAPGNRFFQKMNQVVSRGADRLSASTNLILARCDRLAYWGDLLDLALERADYAQSSVPLGAVRPLLESWEKEWTMLEQDPAMVSRTNERAAFRDRAWIYHSLLKGKKNALTEYLNTGKPSQVLLALDDIEKNSYKDMKYLVLGLFNSASDDAIKLKAARVLMALDWAKDKTVRAYIVSVLGRADVAVTADFVDLVANLKTGEFLVPIAALTNSKDESLREAAFNAFSRIGSSGN
jgi:hypothetical protein